MLKFTIPGRPVPQERPRVTRYGAYDPTKSRKAKRVVAQYGLAELRRMRHDGFGPDYAGAVDMRIRFYGASPLADLDNLYKLVTDALQGVLYKSDAQIQSGEMQKFACIASEARTEIEVQEGL